MQQPDMTMVPRCRYLKMCKNPLTLIDHSDDRPVISAGASFFIIMSHNNDITCLAYTSTQYIIFFISKKCYSKILLRHVYGWVGTTGVSPWFKIHFLYYSDYCDRSMRTLFYEAIIYCYLNYNAANYVINDYTIYFIPYTQGPHIRFRVAVLNVCPGLLYNFQKYNLPSV